MTSAKKNYYIVDGFLYTETFPQEWAKNHWFNTGPKKCKNCLYYGSLNGVFIGYCSNCAANVYHYNRGLGFIDIGTECPIENVNLNYIDDDDFKDMEFIESLSVFETYLKNKNTNDIGDKYLFESSILWKWHEDLAEPISTKNDENCEENEYDDLPDLIPITDIESNIKEEDDEEEDDEEEEDDDKKKFQDFRLQIQDEITFNVCIIC
jgi:hypothetical protein